MGLVAGASKNPCIFYLNPDTSNASTWLRTQRFRSQTRVPDLYRLFSRIWRVKRGIGYDGNCHKGAGEVTGAEQCTG